MRRHPILWLLAGTYLLVVGLWPAAATPVELAATGAFTVVVSARRRPAHVHAGRH